MSTARPLHPPYLIALTGAAALGLLFIGVNTGNSSVWGPGAALVILAAILVFLRARE